MTFTKKNACVVLNMAADLKAYGQTAQEDRALCRKILAEYPEFEASFCHLLSREGN